MFVGMMASGFLFLAVVLVAIGLAINAVWRAVMPPPGLPRHAGCGSCGYELTTLGVGRCSECGADLLKSGVVTRRNVVRTAGSLPAALLGWTLLSMSFGVIILYVVSFVSLMGNAGLGGPGGMAYTSNFTFRPARLPAAPDGSPRTTPDFRVLVDVDVAGNFGTRASSGVITMELSAGTDRAVFTFADASTDDWILTGPDGSELAAAQGIRSDDVLVAFAAVGLRPEDHPDISEYADRIEELVINAYQDPFNYESNINLNTFNQGDVRLYQAGGSSNYSNFNTMMGTGSPADYLIPLGVLAVTGLGWAVGMFFIVRRRARLIEGPRDATDASGTPPGPPPGDPAAPLPV